MEGGNTGFVNTADLSFVSEHPLQNNILGLIKKASLPVVVREAILDDFRQTAIMMSDEKILFKDLSTRLEMMVTKISTDVTTFPNGQTQSTTHTEWTPVEVQSKLGLSIDTGGMIKIPDMDDNELAAYSKAGPKPYVVYFNNAVEKISKSGLIKLVLHEQGHR